METDRTTLVFHALADPTRRRILEVIASKPVHVAQLARRFPVSRPAISKHLMVLKYAGLVSFEERGKKRLYHLEPGPLKLADKWLKHYWHFWEESLRNLKNHMESNSLSAKKRSRS